MFAAAEVGGDRLTDDEILGICFLFILAGLDTVTDTLECFFAYLAQHPEQRRRSSSRTPRSSRPRWKSCCAGRRR